MEQQEHNILMKNFGECLKVVSNGGTNRRIYRTVQNIWTTIGKIFTVSFYAKADTAGRKMNASRSMQDYSQDFILTTGWKKYVGKIILTGTSNEGTLSLRFDETGTYYIADVKLEEGEICTPWCPHIDDSDYDDVLAKTIYDISGNGNDAQLKYNNNYKAINCFVESKIGKQCFNSIKTLPDGQSTYGIIKGKKIFNEVPEITISFWIYRNVARGNNDTETIIGCSYGGSNWGIWISQDNTAPNGLDIYMWHKQLYIDNIINLNQWYYVTVVAKKGEFIKAYINGEKKAQCDMPSPVDWEGTEIFTIGDLRDGRGLTANLRISDVKVYASILSDEDIKQLYNERIKVDNIGNMYCSELNEEERIVEYLESTGTQYILTDIVPHNEMGVYMKLSSSDVNSDVVYFGSRKTSDTRFWVGNNRGTIYFGWNTVKSENRLTTNEIFDFEFNFLNSRVDKYNNTVVENITTSLNSDNNIPLAIFAGNDNSSIKYKPKIKLYELKISEGTYITHDFLPIISTENGHMGEPCLFDIVENKYYYNQGAGTFKTNLTDSETNVNVTDKGILNCKYLIEGNDPAKVLQDENIVKVNEIKEN